MSMRLHEYDHSAQPKPIKKISGVNGHHHGHEHPEGRIIVRYRWYLCCTLAWILALTATWDSIGFISGGNDIARSTALTMVRALPGGIRTAGVPLLLIAGFLIYGLGRRGGRALTWALTAGATYYTFWAAAMFASWFVYGIDAWGAPSKSLVIAILYYLIARTSPHPHESKG